MVPRWVEKAWAAQKCEALMFTKPWIPQKFACIGRPPLLSRDGAHPCQQVSILRPRIHQRQPPNSMVHVPIVDRPAPGERLQVLVVWSRHPPAVCGL